MFEVQNSFIKKRMTAKSSIKIRDKI